MSCKDKLGINRRCFLTHVSTLASLFSSLGANRRSNQFTREPIKSKNYSSLEIGYDGYLNVNGIREVVVGDSSSFVYGALTDGFGVIDISDRANPKLIYEERNLTVQDSEPMDSIKDVKVNGDRLLVSGPAGFNDGLSGFFLYDISTPAHPERVAFHSTSFSLHNSFIHDDHVYMTGSGLPREPVVIYNIENDDPEEVARWSVVDSNPEWKDVESLYATCHDVYVQDNRLYVAYWDAGTWVVDVSSPSDPRAIGRLGDHSLDYLQSLPKSSSEFTELPGNSHYVQPSSDASFIFSGKEAWDLDSTEIDGGPGGIEIWNSTSSGFQLTTVLRPPRVSNEEYDNTTAHNFGIRGNRLYTSWYNGGVRVYDIGTPSSPLLTGEWINPSKTSFWTAKPLKSGFVASSFMNPSNSRQERRNGEGAKLFVFPEPNEDTVPAHTMDRRPYPPHRDDSSSNESTQAQSSTISSTHTNQFANYSQTDYPTTTNPPAGSLNYSTSNEDTNSNSTPGLTALSAILAAGAVTKLLRNQRSKND